MFVMDPPQLWLLAVSVGWDVHEWLVHVCWLLYVFYFEH